MTEGIISISGSRKITSKELVFFLLKFIIKRYRLKPTGLKAGGANGVDKLTEDFFREYFPKASIEVLKPDYAAYPEHLRWKAPLDRNGDIPKDTICLICIWEGVEYQGRKGGTRDARDKALAQGVPVIFVNAAAGTIEYLAPPETHERVMDIIEFEQGVF